MVNVFFQNLSWYYCFSIGLNLIVNSQAEHSHYGQRLKMEQHIFWGLFYWYKDKTSGHFLCAKIFWENFPSPPQTKIWLLLQFPIPLCCDDISTTLPWHLGRAQKRKTNLRSHDLKTSGKKTSKYKSERNFSNIKKAPDDLCDLGLITAT